MSKVFCTPKKTMTESIPQLERISTTGRQGKSVLEMLTQVLYLPNQVRDKLLLRVLVTESLF